MYKFNVINCSQNLNKTEIEEVENSINLNFPSDLKKHYLMFNGGEVEEERFYYLKRTFSKSEINGFSLTNFFPLKYRIRDRQTLFEENYKQIVITQKILSKNYIPIGDDISGWPICYRVDNGWIYNLNREEYNEDGKEKLIHICDSLEEFINGMLTIEEFEELL